MRTKTPKVTLVDNMNTLRQFINPSQMEAMKVGCRGEERQFFLEKFAEMAERVTRMPKTYEQDGKGMEATAYLHYFKYSMDYYIVERDTSEEQFQAFGVVVGGAMEFGYVSIAELINNGVELDLHFEPTKLVDLR